MFIISNLLIFSEMRNYKDDNATIAIETRLKRLNSFFLNIQIMLLLISLRGMYYIFQKTKLISKQF